ncbi:hypothetical protein T11_16605 [Trichinella zimbabwensis]|uniref:Uncharacterized protein n=1 Tax=Trichinella zimbabwensis TaxID=268475 RepID=A0A0V1GCB0_9BILA|nr:hypothetical protein T11_16605 [Trichinella zimbabwensis]
MTLFEKEQAVLWQKQQKSKNKVDKIRKSEKSSQNLIKTNQRKASVVCMVNKSFRWCAVGGGGA